MTHDSALDPLFLPPLLALGWMLLVALASILHRTRHGRPVLFFGYRDAQAQERSVSGRSLDGLLHRFAGARHLLIVARRGDEVIVRPPFPSTLCFWPEMLGLEHVIPLAYVEHVTASRRPGKRTPVQVRYRTADGTPRTVELELLEPGRFFPQYAPPPTPPAPPGVARFPIVPS